jgi:hypothetical protein
MFLLSVFTALPTRRASTERCQVVQQEEGHSARAAKKDDGVLPVAASCERPITHLPAGSIVAFGNGALKRNPKGKPRIPAKTSGTAGC